MKKDSEDIYIVEFEEEKEKDSLLDDKEIRQISEDVTLKVLRIIGDKTNFGILNMLPSYPEVVQEKVGLSDYQYLKHIKQLKKYELIQEDNKTHEIQLTNSGKSFIELINYIIEATDSSIKMSLGLEEE